MPQSFTLQSPLQSHAVRKRRVLVTGAAGRIGSCFAEQSHQRYDLRLMVRGDQKKENVEKILGFGEVVLAELSDLSRLKELCAGIDTVLHLAANPSAAATWDSLLPDNIVGTYHVFTAAKSAGVRRVIFASSIHAVSGYRADVQVKSTDPVNPGDLYGVTKCFGEALARYMAEQENVSAICLRIGGFQPLEYARDEKGIAMLDAWVSRRDLVQLIQRCIDDETLRFAIFAGLSDNRFKRMDITDARELLGYAPEDAATREVPKVKDLHLDERVIAHNTRDDHQPPGTRNETGSPPQKRRNRG